MNAESPKQTELDGLPKRIERRVLELRQHRFSSGDHPGSYAASEPSSPKHDGTKRWTIELLTREFNRLVHFLYTEEMGPRQD